MFVIEKLEEKLHDDLGRPEAWVERVPSYAKRFDAIADLRSFDRLNRGKQGDWKMVASIIGPVLDVGRVLDEDFLKDKRKFYAWLDRNPAYCVYDRRRGGGR